MSGENKIRTPVEHLLHLQKTPSLSTREVLARCRVAGTFVSFTHHFILDLAAIAYHQHWLYRDLSSPSIGRNQMGTNTKTVGTELKIVVR